MSLSGSEHLQPEENYFETHKPQLEALFAALNREQYWSEDPIEVAAYTNPQWVGSDHGNQAEKDQFTEDEEAAARPILEELGFYGEILPPENTHYSQALVVGGKTQANYRREAVVHKAIAERGVSVDNIIFWLGQRPRSGSDGTLDELLSTEGRFAGREVVGDRWVRQQLEQKLWDGPEWGRMFGDETDLGRVAMLKQVEGAKLQRIRIDMTPQHLEGVPPRWFSDYEFTAGDGQKLTIMNTAAAPRKHGAPRHTTRLCTVEWLERHAPLPNERVLFVASNPHIRRTAATTRRTMRQLGRSDIQMDIAGASAPSNAELQLVLGEVGSLIHNDVRNLTADK